MPFLQFCYAAHQKLVLVHAQFIVCVQYISHNIREQFYAFKVIDKCQLLFAVKLQVKLHNYQPILSDYCNSSGTYILIIIDLKPQNKQMKTQPTRPIDIMDIIKSNIESYKRKTIEAKQQEKLAILSNFVQQQSSVNRNLQLKRQSTINKPSLTQQKIKRKYRKRQKTLDNSKKESKQQPIVTQLDNNYLNDGFNNIFDENGNLIIAEEEIQQFRRKQQESINVQNANYNQYSQKPNKDQVKKGKYEINLLISSNQSAQKKSQKFLICSEKLDSVQPIKISSSLQKSNIKQFNSQKEEQNPQKHSFGKNVQCIGQSVEKQIQNPKQKISNTLKSKLHLLIIEGKLRLGFKQIRQKQVIKRQESIVVRKTIGDKLGK